MDSANSGFPVKPYHWLMVAVVFGILILWVIPVDASALLGVAGPPPTP